MLAGGTAFLPWVAGVSPRYVSVTFAPDPLWTLPGAILDEQLAGNVVILKVRVHECQQRTVKLAEERREEPAQEAVLQLEHIGV